MKWCEQYKLLHFKEIGSTNSQAIRMARTGVMQDYALLADIQTASYGQRGRSWQSLLGNLHLSVLLRADEELSIRRLELPFLVGNVLYDVIKQLLASSTKFENLSVKWPNDILIENKKLAGILVESILISEQLYIIIGVGVNIAQSPVLANGNACTSLREYGVSIGNLHFTDKFMQNFQDAFVKWRDEGSFRNTRNSWLNKAIIGKMITIDRSEKKIVGIFKGITELGEAVVMLKDGSVINIC